MMRRVRPGLRWVSVAAAALVTGTVAIAAPVLVANQPSSEPVAQAASGGTTTPQLERGCTVVDTDAGLDDFRALAVLLPGRDVRAVVLTEGVAGVQNGATAVSMFLASRGVTPPVITGLASANPPDYDWLPAARAGAERLDNYFHDAVSFGGDPSRLKHDVGAALTGCTRVELLVLGPWTSYLKYVYNLGSRVDVVVSGLSFAENNSDNFNCDYDIAACKAAVPLLKANAKSTAYVELPPAGDPLTYDPTEAWVAQFEGTGMPGLLRTALQVDPSQWLGTRLWDDAAALFVLAPGNFRKVGGHYSPAVSETTFRTLLANAINAG